MQSMTNKNENKIKLPYKSSRIRSKRYFQKLKLIFIKRVNIPNKQIEALG